MNSFQRKRTRKKGLLLLLLVLSVAPVFGQPVTGYVDLFICTAGDHGQQDPSATVPFGMVKLGPDTDPVNHSGYDYNSERIKGFSHNRIGGAGCVGAGGDLRILPGIGDLDDQSSPYIKESEKASPGYYTVRFTNGILAELTATNQTGIHRYTFPRDGDAFIMVDIASSFTEHITSSRSILGQNGFNATVSAKNACDIGRYTVNYHVWSNKKLQLAKEEDNKLYFRFPDAGDGIVELYVTTSPIGTDDARKEWESETKEITFEQAVDESRKKWENLLSRIIVEGKEEYKILFYTHLYHTLLNPVKTDNRNKEFRATDGKVHRSEDYGHYDTWSMWDNFRNKFSLYSLIIPDISSGITHSLVDLYKYGKAYWSGYNEPVPTARTEHTVITLLDMYRRGVTGFDAGAMYERLSAEVENIYEGSPDTKLEKSYDYWALAQFARILDKEDDYRLFMQKSGDYKRIWKEKFLPITEKSDIMHGDGLYEGTLWQYRWHVQFDVDGIIEMIGSKEKYTDQLEYFFDNNLYNHGNQPDIHVPFMFNFGTRPWLTQKWTNAILTKEMVQHYGTHVKWEEPYFGRIYKAEPEGYIPEMDDDEGTMSGWYVLSSMGLYPVLVGDPVFQISSPIFDRVTIKLDNGKIFEIESRNLSDTSFYIQSATLRGKPFNQTYIDNTDILQGGKLVFELSGQPNENWPGKCE